MKEIISLIIALSIIVIMVILKIKAEDSLIESRKAHYVIEAYSIYQKLYSSYLAGNSTDEDLNEWKDCYDIFSSEIFEAKGYPIEKIEGLRQVFIEDFKDYLHKHHPEHEILK